MPEFARRGGVLSVIPVAALAAAGVPAGCPAPTATVAGAPRAVAAVPSVAAPSAAVTPGAGAGRLPEQVPGLGPRTPGRVPDDARQVVVVTGAGRNASRSRVVAYERTPTAGAAARDGPRATRSAGGPTTTAAATSARRSGCSASPTPGA